MDVGIYINKARSPRLLVCGSPKVVAGRVVCRSPRLQTKNLL